MILKFWSSTGAWHRILPLQENVCTTRRIIVEIASAPGHVCGGRPAGGRGDGIAAVIRIQLPRQLQLFHVGQTFDALGLHFGPGQCRQQHRRQDGDDGDHHQQFNQRKPAFGLHKK